MSWQRWQSLAFAVSSVSCAWFESGVMVSMTDVSQYNCRLQVSFFFIVWMWGWPWSDRPTASCWRCDRSDRWNWLWTAAELSFWHFYVSQIPRISRPFLYYTLSIIKAVLPLAASRMIVRAGAENGVIVCGSMVNFKAFWSYPRNGWIAWVAANDRPSRSRSHSSVRIGTSGCLRSDVCI